jgi:hypothetical protein
VKGSRATLKRKWRMTKQRSSEMRLRPDANDLTTDHRGAV